MAWTSCPHPGVKLEHLRATRLRLFPQVANQRKSFLSSARLRANLFPQRSCQAPNLRPTQHLNSIQSRLSSQNPRQPLIAPGSHQKAPTKGSLSFENGCRKLKARGRLQARLLKVHSPCSNRMSIELLFQLLCGHLSVCKQIVLS